MKIAFVSSPGYAVLPPAGSLEIWTRQVAERLAAEHEVTVLASRPPGGEERAQEAGIEYRFLSHGLDGSLARLARPLFRLRSPARPFFASPLYPLTYWIRAGLALRRDRTEVAHVLNYTQALPILTLLAPDTRLVVHMTCEWLTELDERLIARRLRHAAAILACSDAITGQTGSRFPSLADRCATVFNGVDLDALDGPLTDERHACARLLFVGRISPEKGLHVLMDAFEELARRRPELELTLVGEEAVVPKEMLVDVARDERVRALAEFYDGSYEEALVARLSPEVRPRVTLTGRIEYAEVAAHYRSANVFVLPSFREAFGMPAAEALAAGVPVVASRTGGIVEVVEDGVTGLLVEPGDTDGLARAIERLLDDRELRDSVIRAGRVKARALFGWDAVTQALERELLTAADGPLASRVSASEAGASS